MLTYKLFKNQSILLSATSRAGQADAGLHPVQNQTMLLSAMSRKSQSDADLQTVQNPEHALFSNKQRKMECFETYKLFIKFESMLLSAPQDESKQNINLHSI